MKANDDAGQADEAFPLRIKRAGVSVSIYKTVNGAGYQIFQVADYSSGRRRLRSFADLAEARREADRLASALARGDVAAASVRGKDAASYARAIELLKPTGVSLESAAAAFAEACQIMGSNRIVDAARFYATRNPASIPAKTIKEAAAEFIAARQQDNASKRYLKDLNYRLGRLAQDFTGNLSNLDGKRLEAWLRGLGLSPQSRVNFIRVVGAFLRFCIRQGWLPRGWDELERIEKPKVKRGAIEIFTADEMAKLLAVATRDFLPALAIGGFCGLRSAELERLDWTEIHLPERFIEVTAGKAKTASRRIVPISENLALWLTPLAVKSGRVWPLTHDGFYDAQQDTAQAAGVPWKPNALRHSFISYRLAAVQNTEQVALEAGNSPAVIFSHYREPVRTEEAKRWFGICPPQSAENVISLAKATA